MWIHGALYMQERKDESQIYNYQRIQLSNDKFMNGILAGMLDCKSYFWFSPSFALVWLC